jgi:hypothetical protein
LIRIAVFAACLLLWAAHAFAGIAPNCSQTPPARDQANAVVSGSFTGTGKSSCFLVWGNFNVVIYGSSPPNGTWNGTVQLERSFDGGTTWIVAGVGGSGAQAVYSTPNQDVSVIGYEPEKGVAYRLDCTAYTSGTINYRMSTTGSAATTVGPP